MSLMIIISLLLSSFIIIISYIIQPRSKSAGGLDKVSQYECGLEPFEEEIGIETRERFYLKFYIIGIIFLVFDLESILLYPITMILLPKYYPILSGFNYILSYIVFLIFMILLIIGLIYEYRKKVL